MRYLILWEIAPDKMREFIRLEMKDLTPIPEGVKYQPTLEFLTPGGLMVTVVEADSPEPLFVWTQSFLHIFKNVRIEPALTYDEWSKLCETIEKRARPQVEEAKRMERE